jgi:aryl-alcohol dehydrogenase-like predicted oxidoreductase
MTRGRFRGDDESFPAFGMNAEPLAPRGAERPLSGSFGRLTWRFTPEERKANRPLVTLLEDTGRQKGATTALALAWLLAQKPWIVPILGTTKLSRLEENLGAASLKLAPEELNDLEEAASRITIQGGRYPRELEKLSGR